MRKIYLLDREDCVPCEELKENLREEIEEGRVEVLQVTSDEALELLDRAGVGGDGVPFPSALVEDEGGVRLCEVYQSNDITLSRCGDEVIAIRQRHEPRYEPEEPPEPEEPEEIVE